jgi:hypothetical protein
MSGDKWDQAQILFHAAADLLPPERARFLDEACLGDHALRLEVEGLIKADPGSEEFLRALIGREAARLLALPRGRRQCAGK